jgi:hypothetical protein
MPLRVVSWAGVVASGASLVMFAYTVLEWLRGATVIGWASLASIVLIIGGLQLLFLGVLGEYVGRIYMESKHRPLFVVREMYRAKGVAAQEAGAGTSVPGR